MPTDPSIFTKEELREILDASITQAYRNGVTVDNGGYELRHVDTDIPDWEVHITRTTKAPRHEHQPVG